MVRFPDIVLRLSDQEGAKIADSLQKSGVDIKTTGNEVRGKMETGSLGMMAISETSEEFAQTLGLPGPVARKLGDSMADLAVSFGAFATGIGAAVVAVPVAITAIMKFNAHKRELRETLDRSVQSLRGQVDALYETAGVSESLRKATYDFTIAKRDLLKIELRRLIGAENEEILKNEKLLAQRGPVLEQLWINLKSQFAGLDATAVMKQRAVEMDAYLQRLRAQIAVSKARLRSLRADLSEISKLEPGYEKVVYPLVTQMNFAIERERADLELLKAQKSISLQRQTDKELALYDRETYLSLYQMKLAARSAEEQEKYLAVRKMRGISMELANHKRIYELNFETTLLVFGGIADLTDQMYRDSSEQWKWLYYMRQHVTAANAYYRYASAAANTEDDGYYGFYLAMFYWFLAFAVPAAIYAETIEGNNGRDPASDFSVPIATSFASDEKVRSRTIRININGKTSHEFRRKLGVWVHDQLPASDDVKDQFDVTYSKS